MFRRMLENGTMMLISMAITFVISLWGLYSHAIDGKRATERCEGAGGVEVTSFGDTVCIRRDALIQGIYK